jgi:hypothetical protein
MKDGQFRYVFATSYANAAAPYPNLRSLGSNGGVNLSQRM